MGNTRLITILGVGIASAMAWGQPGSATDLGLLPGDRVLAPATNTQADVSIAKGTSSSLVVWSDFRGRSSGSQTIQGDGDIFGMRIDAAGNPLDPVPFVVAGGFGLQQRPMVAFNGTDWLVVYQSQDPVGGYFDTRVRAVRVSGGGQVLDTVPISFPPTQFTPDTIGLTVAGAGGTWLVARCVYHADTGYGTFLGGQRINSSGQVLDADPIMLMDWTYGTLNVVGNGNEFLVAGPEWNNSSSTRAQRVSLSGQPVGPIIPLPANFWTLASSGSGYYVVWQPNATSTLLGSRMTSTGTLLTPAGTTLSSSFQGSDLSMSHDGVNWWLSWTLSNVARVMRINSSGTVLDPGGVQLPINVTGSINSLYSARIVGCAGGGGGGAVFTWHDYRAALGSDSNVFAMPVSAGGTPGAERCISIGTPSQRSSELCLGPTGDSAAALVSDEGGRDRVLVYLLDAQGRPRGPEPIEVRVAPAIGRAGIAFNGSVYMVAWDEAVTPGQSTTMIRARRMAIDGSFIDAQAFDVMPGFNAAIGSLGSNFLVAGARFATYPQTIFMVGARVDGSTGALLDGPGGLNLGGGYVSGAPRVRSDGTQWLVAAHSQWTHDSSQGDAILAKVPPVGAPAPAFNPTPFAGGTGDLDVAFSGSKYLLVWRNNSLSNANNYIAGRIMNLDGTYQPAFVIAEATGRQLRPTAVWDGSAFLVAWDDQRNQSYFFDYRTDIYAVHVSDTGVVLDPAPMLLVNRAGPECSPSIVVRAGMTLVSSTRFVTDGAYDSYRVGISRMGAPTCPGDFDASGSVSVQDVFLFLSAWFAGDPRADMNHADGVTVQDVFEFLAVWFMPC